MAIEGVNDATVMSIISEIELEGVKKFASAKQFTSWLRLAPQQQNIGREGARAPSAQGQR